MTDIIAITQRAADIVVERTEATLAALQQQQNDTGGNKGKGDAAQRRKRAAYDEVAASASGEFAPARDAFEAEYGEGEYGKQQGLGLRRQAKAEGEG